MAILVGTQFFCRAGASPAIPATGAVAVQTKKIGGRRGDRRYNVRCF
jgi:hypothetical protein